MFFKYISVWRRRAEGHQYTRQRKHILFTSPLLTLFLFFFVESIYGKSLSCLRRALGAVVNYSNLDILHNRCVLCSRLTPTTNIMHQTRTNKPERHCWSTAIHIHIHNTHTHILLPLLSLSLSLGWDGCSFLSYWVVISCDGWLSPLPATLHPTLRQQNRTEQDGHGNCTACPSPLQWDL